MARRGVRFAVVCKSARPGEHLRVVGASAALGQWVPERSEVALSTSASDFPLWHSDWLDLPQASEDLEYKYVICGPEGFRWENRPNRHLSAAAVLPAAATVREVFDREDSPKIQASDDWLAPPLAKTSEAELLVHKGSAGGVLVRFSVKCKQAEPGQELRVVGSIGVLGNWAPDSPSAVLLQTSAAEFPMWRSDWIAVPAEQCRFEYKYVLKGPGSSVSWEDCSNRRMPRAGSQVQSGKYRMTLSDAFGKTGTGCVLEPHEQPETVEPPPPQAPAPIPAPTSEKALSRPASPQKDRASDLWKTVQESLPVRKNMPRNPASFCTLMQALQKEMDSELKAEQGLVKMRRANTIGCIDDLPEGLVPTKRSLGLQPANGDLDLVREAVCSEYAGTEDVIVERDSSYGEEATTAASSDESTDTTNASRIDETWSSSRSPQVQTLGGKKPLGFCIGESEAEPKRPKTFEDGYLLNIKVGEGAFGVVYRCTARRGGPDLAVKVVNKDRLTQYALQSLLGDEASGREGEISLHQSLPPHEHIVGIHDCFHETHVVRLVMDMCRGGDLFDAILRAKQRNRARCKDEAFSEPAAANVVRQVLSAVEFCHQHGVVHRDVKAENVLLALPEDEVPLDSGKAVVKLCDFGLSARCWASEGSKLRDPVGSPDYVAPEVARQEAYGQSVDIWSCGVLLFASLRGRLPFPARTDHEALVLVKEGKVTYDKGWDYVSPEARACTEHMLKLTPSERPTAQKAQEHPFFCAADGLSVLETARGG